MKRYRQHILYISLCLGLLITPFCCSNIGAKDFVVVIDAGHGGHDPGAIGRISKEKNINLNVALKLGKQIQKNCPDVKVVYTRTRDVFIPLNRRAEIANDAKADLFISIHTNALANNRTAKGASTWTLGLAKSDANLEVAKRENSVILYESDYKTRYAGFNPNSAESYIIFEFMQDKYMSQSVHLASLVQKHFRNTCRRVDRGVHQAGFLVLKASAMPSILVELGFISTPEEERYLNTDAGTNTLANGIFRAFLTYKREQEIRLNGSSQTILPEDLPQPEEKTPAPADASPETEKKATVQNNKPAPQPSEKATVAQTEDKVPVFKIQILTSSRPLAKNDKRLKGLKNVDYYKEGGLYKYTYGASSVSSALSTSAAYERIVKQTVPLVKIEAKKRSRPPWLRPEESPDSSQCSRAVFSVCCTAGRREMAYATTPQKTVGTSQPSPMSYRGSSRTSGICTP